MVVTRAIRDEGTSSHYFPSEVKLESTVKLRNIMVRILEREKLCFHVGSVWTTDGVYRETKKKYLKYRSENVLVVNMETSALYAVAKYRNVEIASLQVVSDTLSEKGWSPAFQNERVIKGFKRLISCAVEGLSTSNS